MPEAKRTPEYYQVTQTHAVLAFPDAPPEVQIWARHGEIVEASHPVLAAIVKAQGAKVTRLGTTTLDAAQRQRLRPVRFQRILTEMARVDAEIAGQKWPDPNATPEAAAAAEKADATDGSEPGEIPPVDGVDPGTNAAEAPPPETEPAPASEIPAVDAPEPAAPAKRRKA